MVASGEPFPIYRQVSQYDCGPTCLRMISSYYGKQLSLADISNALRITKQGVSIYSLGKVAEQIGFTSASVTISYESLMHSGATPCILHIRGNHFVVLISMTSDEIQIADPGMGLVRLTKKEFIANWITPNSENQFGVALILKPTEKFLHLSHGKSSTQTYSARSRIIELFSHLFRYRRQLIYLVLILLAASLVQLAFPLLTQAIVDKGINSKNISLVYLLLLGQLLLTIGRISLDFGKRWILLKLSLGINKSMLSIFIAKLVRLPASFFEHRMIGDIHRRIEDHYKIEKLLSSTFISFIFSIVNISVYSLLLVLYNWKVFIVFFLASLLMIIPTILNRRRRLEIEGLRFRAAVSNSSATIELIQGMIDIKLNGWQKMKQAAWWRSQLSVFDVRVRTIQLQQYQESSVVVISEIRNLVIVLLAASEVISGSMTFGAMLAMQYMVGQCASPVNELVSFAIEYQEANSCMNRIEEINNVAIASDPSAGLANPVAADLVGDLKISHVNFTYPNTKNVFALRNVCAVLPRGKVTAIMGRSGGGKTTLLKLLMKIHPLQQGSISVGTTDLASLDEVFWSEKCGVVMQDGFIFSDSIAQNIALSEDGFDINRLNEVIQVANLTEFIAGSSNGLNTQIGTSGIGISQGQKQRILIARALYKNPEYLFFDEATSALDGANETRILQNIAHRMKDKTLIIIAHRLSTVRNADQILVLDSGQIAESGTHQSLIEKKGVYYELVKDQIENSD